MISEVRLRDFKCFEEVDLPLAPLTLLSGINSAGKSTVLQALLLLRQSARSGELLCGRFVLNGDLVQLGSFGATRRDDAPLGSAIEIAVAWEDGANAGFRLKESGEVETSAPPTDWAERPPLSLCRYVSADRTGPRAVFPTSDVLVKTGDDFGPRGEFFAHYLALHGPRPIHLPSLSFRGADFGSEFADAASPKLKDQVEAWLGLVAPGVRLDVMLHELMDVVQLGFRFPGASGLSDSRRPTHVGFGLTYALPILVTILSSKPGGLVIIENPEAHLHPRAQRRLVHLLARAASAGVQVIVETHSDHVLNGVRVAVRKKAIQPSQVRVHFFAQEAPRARPSVMSPSIDSVGALSDWPTGFFDEWDRALDDLLE